MITLNTQQQLAVDCDDRKVLCLACAGAGKTQVLISRLWRLVSHDNVDPRSILCLTFTRAAALEMRERYAKLQKAHRDATSEISEVKPEISTFHAFCYSLIVHDSDVRQKIGYTKPPKILDPKDMKKYQAEVMLQCNIRLPLKKLKPSAKRTRSEEMEFALYTRAIKRSLKNQGYITFDILCNDVCKLFHSKDTSIQKYLDRYTHILIDEFQDTDATQVKFMESFENASWFCVGDALQNLYSFRGTSNEFIKKYSQDDSWTKIKMDQNYRSTKQICDFANANSKYASPEYRIELHANKLGAAVEEDCYCKPDTNVEPFNEFILDRVLGFVNKGHETAILCRTNAEVDYVTSYLSNKGINFAADKKDTTAENILKSSLDDQYLIDWLSTYLPSDRYANYIRLKTIEDNPDAKWFIQNFGKAFWINKYLNVIFNIRRAMLAASQEKQTSSEMIQTLANILELDVGDSSEYEGLGYREAIDAFIEKIYETRISELYVGTVHSVKGLEFEDVIILGVKGPQFRLNSEDNHNVYYVAITRAKERLVIVSNI